MKKILSIFLFAFFGLGISAQAQVVKKTGQHIKTGAKKAGNKTAEVASKGKAKATDKTVKDKTGPNNETIYLEDDGRYYWINKKGRKIYIPASALKNKQ